MKEETIKIEGMACGHCRATVEKAISSVPGVQQAKVSLEDKNAVVDYDPEVADIKAIKDAVTDAGYNVVD
ncbi:copper ion binding protein [Methanolobus sp. ZRKC3]|uniref:heavy-metal-associated domain-containing protein n=1 Tax=Methanolobus sp. ZRKC3 TaxID=3125786 RepID=UPI003253D5D6